ncbi:MAG: hypothetical protein LPK07_13765 [Hymenobacteraceae bacterium]|nr:hypothetical protein [Hymenobacteraceae bacterium]
MKTNLPILFLWLALLWVPANAFAQEVPALRYRSSVPLSSPTTISQDRSGNVYLLGKNRNLVRLDSLGRPLGTFSPPTRGRIAGIDAWNPMKVLLFYEDRQELLLLDRFLRPITNASLMDLNYEGTAHVAALAADDGFWLFDETNLTLSKLDIRLRQTTAETPLNLILDRERFDVRQLREHQNMVYLLDYTSGIYVFDNLGNYKQKLPFTGLQHIGFLHNELYFVQDGQLHFFDLYTQERRSIALPANKPYVAALVAGETVYLFTAKAADLYNLQ